MNFTEENASMKIREAQFRFGRLMREVNQKLNASEDFDDILDFLFDAMAPIIPYHRIGIALVEGDKLCSRWVRSKTPASHLRSGYCGPLAGSSLKEILDSGRPRIINDLVEYGRRKPESESTKLALKDGIRSSLTCPVYSGHIPIGIVFFSSFQPDTYKSEHIETYLEIADELSFLINHDRMRDEAQRGNSTRQNVRMLLHDLRSPLGVIQGFLEFAQGEDWYEGLGSDAKSIFTTLQRNAVHMAELINELAELNQLNRPGGQVEFREVDIPEFLYEVEMAGQEMASRKEIHFTLERASELPAKYFFDPVRIRRVLDNLISNAVKYSQRGTSLRVVVRFTKSRLYFDVIDQGQGIPESEFPVLFVEFGKTSVRPTEGESSSGIGLAIVKKIVEQHGGQISVVSEVGKGSNFIFWIPQR